MGEKFTNRLIHESSPYLKQHAHNPVDWYPWGEEALQKAKDRDVPVLVSIGYSACHWCHVMEHESFEDEQVAAYMNEHFVNIKIDREERPDLDHIYMDAVQAIAGTGGWPLNVFLTTESKPFYGGTYFPPKKAFNRPSWLEILAFISDLWNNKKDEVLNQAQILIDHVSSSGQQLLNVTHPVTESGEAFTAADCRTINDNILSKADIAYGGFGAAPKFPQTFTLQYLLTYGHFFNNNDSLKHAFFSLKQLLNGGIYDHLAGGMARYSTDKEWLAPHFEKMLYDNALLVHVLCDAYQISADKDFEDGIIKTLDFLIRDMKHPEGGFYAALDADTEGVEGKFYVWDKKEIEDILKEDAELCCAWYGVTEAGNWEEKNILHVHTDINSFSASKNIEPVQLVRKIESWNNKLFKHRETRIHPSIDDKILIGWNALLITALCKSYAAVQSERYKSEAIALFKFIQEKFAREDGSYFHTYKNDNAQHPAFLDDYAYLIQSCIFLQEITSDLYYLDVANQLTEYVVKHFSDPETGMFFFTNDEQKDVVIRKTEIYDGAVPSGNSIMADNLLYLAVVFDKKEWFNRASEMLQKLKEVILKYPTSFGVWGTTFLKQHLQPLELVVTGTEIGNVVKEILTVFLPNKVFLSSSKPVDLPLLKDKNYGEPHWIYLCKQYTCSKPVRLVEELKKEVFRHNLNIKDHNN